MKDTESLLPPELEQEMASIYADMAEGYQKTAEAIGLSCDHCPDNCCDSYFLHYTYCEWAYLWQGLRQLEPECLQQIRTRAHRSLEASRSLLARGERPQLMCPLNLQGRCQLYSHRLMICRCHGVPATLLGPRGSHRFPGCFRCQELVRQHYTRAELAPAMDRTALFRRLALVEQRLRDQRGLAANHGRIRLSIAEMIVQGPPQA